MFNPLSFIHRVLSIVFYPLNSIVKSDLLDNSNIFDSVKGDFDEHLGLRGSFQKTCRISIGSLIFPS